MHGMGATVIDVAREFTVRLQAFGREFEGVLDTAFVEHVPSRNQLRLTTLLARDGDRAAEDSLARLELEVERSFKEIPLAFSTIHLRGRPPADFIPAEALVIFGDSARRRADAVVSR